MTKTKLFFAITLIAAAAAFLVSVGTVNAQTIAQCPVPDASKSDSYKSGFTAGCPKGANGEAEASSKSGSRSVEQEISESCNVNKAPSQFDSVQWRTGCLDGYAAGQEVFQKNIAAWPPGGVDIGSTCTGFRGYTTLSSIFQPAYLEGCMVGYRWTVNHPITTNLAQASTQLAENSMFCNTFSLGNVNTKNGCLGGYSKATEDFEASFPELTPPTQSEERLSERLSHCEKLPIPGSGIGPDAQRSGIKKGCAVGYTLGYSGAANTCSNGVPSDPRSSKHYFYNLGYKDACQKGYQLGQADKQACETGLESESGEPCGDQGSKGGGIVPECNPALPPSHPDGCGIGAFIKLLQNIIRYLLLIVIPIAVLLIGWAGFTIMTAAGSEEKLTKGKHMITIALTGVVITAVGYLIIKLIFTVLSVDSDFTPGGI